MGKQLPASEAWKRHILHHTDLVELSPRLWQITGSLKATPLPRNMLIYKLSDGGLLIHSAIALDESTMSRLLSLGHPKVMIVPSRLHRLDCGVWKQRFPALQVVAPASERVYVEKVIKVDQTAEDALPILGVVVHKPRGLKALELTYELDLDNTGATKALVFNDALFNLDHIPGIRGLLIRLIGSSGFFGITRLGRLAMLNNPGEYKAWLLEMAAIPGLRIITVAHGDAVVGQAEQALHAAAGRL